MPGKFIAMSTFTTLPTPENTPMRIVEQPQLERRQELQDLLVDLDEVREHDGGGDGREHRVVHGRICGCKMREAR